MKKILNYLIIFIIAISFAASAVSATELVKHDFGEFTALSPEDAKYDEETSEMFRYYINENESIAYFYMNSEFIHNDTINLAYNRLNEMGFEKINATKNLTLFEIKTGDFSDYVRFAVEVHTKGKMVCVAGNNTTELGKIGSSVSFH